jgi:acyl-CoA reductase-like NAD-dependent aldehyde dehydrogenase
MQPPALDVLPNPALLIGDERVVTSSGGQVAHVYAATGQVTRELPIAGRKEVDAAVVAAAEGAKAWWALAPEQRRDAMTELARVLHVHAAEMEAVSMTDTATKTKRFASIAANTVAYNAGWCDKLDGEAVVGSVGNGVNIDWPVPYGVVGIIIPWNAPLITMANVISPALAAGNAVVVKASDLAPFAALRVGELCLEAGFPPGVVNVLPGGQEAGEALVAHPGVGKVHFTGSTRTGRLVAKSAAERLAPVGLELGGKSANIVFDDADLEFSARVALTAATGLNGQVCTAGTRLLVQESVYADFVDRLSGLIDKVVVGDPADRSTGLGPVISEAAATRILGVIEQATDAEGGRLVSGGRRLGGDLAGGFFVAPTLVADVDPASNISREEVFGPVLAVMPFGTEEDAVALANDNDYGLAGYIQTQDLQRGQRVADALDVGMVYVNGGLPAHPPGAPFGGMKNSGYGRTGGRVGVEEFLQRKNVWMAR